MKRQVKQPGASQWLGHAVRGGARAARAGRMRSGLRVEALEERRLLTSLDISGGVLTYSVTAGSASALTISIDPSDAADVIFTDPDQTPTIFPGAALEGWSYFSATHQAIGPADSFSSVDVTGATTSGQSLTLDFTTGEMLTSGGLSFTPTAASAGNSNSLTLTPGTGSEAFLSETYSPTGAGAGTLSYTDSGSTVVPVVFSNLSPVTDTVPSPTFIFNAPNAPDAATTVNVVAGPSGTTQINDGGAGNFELVNFANKATVTVNVANPGATTTVDTTTASAGLTQLFVDSGVGTDTVDVEGTPSGVTTTTDTGSPSGSTTSVGLNGLLSSLFGPVVVQSTGGSNGLTVDDSSEGAAQTYTLDNSVITASSLPSKITLGGTGLTTLNLDSSGGSTVNLSALAQGGVTTYNFTGGTGLGNNTLKINSDQTTLDDGTAGTLTFGSGQPTVNYTNFATIDVTKPASQAVGSSTTVKGIVGQPLTGAVVATFTESDLANTSNGFVASINWGDSTTTAGTIVPSGTGSYDVTGNHTYATAGTYSVVVTLTNQGTSGSTTVSGTTINVTANGPLSPITITSSAQIAASAAALPANSVYDLTGSTLLGVVQDVQTTQDVATFKSTAAAAVAANFTATINWGDGTPTTAGTITEDAAGIFHVVGTHIYTKAGSFTPTVTITDSNGTTYATGSLNQTNLVSSVAGMAAVTDPNLVNPWGMSSSTTSPIWVSDQGSGDTTVYNPNASPIAPLLTITVPPTGTPSGPTGQVFNTDSNTSDFIVPGSSPAAPAKFLFATLAGTIDAWASGASAAIAQTVTGATFTGLTEANATISGTTSYYLYAADFSGTTGANGIDVFDPTFTGVTGTGNTFDPASAFVDPNAVAGYNPYNIALLNGNLYVTYTKPSGIVTTGGGYIDEFSTSGAFISRIYTDTAGTNLAGPWGMAIAPGDFGTFGGDLLVGNFGDSTSTAPSGTIVAIDLTNDTLAGTIDLANGNAASNAGQWGLLFGNGGSGGSTDTLYITAGINGQTGGLFAAISPSISPSVTVAAAPLTATGATISGIEGNALVNSLTGTGPVLVATFMDTGTPGAATSYTATIDWGDGTPATTGTIVAQGTPDGTVYSVYGNHTYYAAGTFPVTATITNTANGAVAVASGQADIAPMLIADTPPTVTTPERTIFSGPVGEFTEPDPNATAGMFSALIDWGDGSPESAGTISLVGSTATSTTFLITGTHTYADLYGTTSATSAAQTSSTFPISIHVVGTDAAGINLANTATVTGGPFVVSGFLDPASDSGASDSDDITNVVQPTFDGTASEPFARIDVYADAVGSTNPTGGTLLGTTTAGSTGAWSLTSGVALPDGGYTIAALATDATNKTITNTATVVPDLVIDTVGPKVTGVSFDRFGGKIVVTFQDYGGLNNTGSGLVMSSLIDANNYQLVQVHHPRVGKYRINVISDVPGTTSGTQTVTLSVNGGKYIRGGWYFFTIDSASPSDPSGVRDVAGNALDGEFYGYFPSGNNVPGGNFVAQLTAIHHTIYAPSTVVGRATPVSPPGTRAGNQINPGTVNPSSFPRSSSSAKGSASTRQSVKVVHHSDSSRSHLIKQDHGPKVAAHDRALDQVGSSSRTRRS